MSGLRERIAEALVINVTPGAGWAERLADVLLSLPGVAVVELPEAQRGRHNWTLFGCFAIYDNRPGEVYFGRGAWISPQQARSYAAALLAAAAATESVTP